MAAASTTTTTTATKTTTTTTNNNNSSNSTATAATSSPTTTAATATTTTIITSTHSATAATTTTAASTSSTFTTPAATTTTTASTTAVAVAAAAIISSTSLSSSSTPQRKPKRSSLRKPGQRASSTSGEDRHVAFNRSRSLSAACKTRSRSSGDYGSYGEVNEGQSQLCRVRSFKSTSKGLVRYGESFKSPDTKTFMSTGSVRVYRTSSLIDRSDSVDSTDSSIGGSSVAESYYRVSVLGVAGVGKTALVKQFLSSEEKGGHSSTDKQIKSPVTVSVLLDGEESLLEFRVNHHCENWNTTLSTVTGYSSPTEPEPRSHPRPRPGEEPLDDHHLDLYRCDAYTVVFALNDVTTFQQGHRCLRYLREDLGTDRAIILVGNKSDLVRQRHVSHKEACALAHKYDCKYVETSAVLGHNTDELLVGTLRQIRLKLSTSGSTSRDETFYDVKSTRAKKPHHKWQRLVHLYRFLHGDSRSVDSCQDLFV